MKRLSFTGAATAVVTPMKKDGSLDINKYKQLIDWQIKSGIDAIVAVGTTGENAVLSADEHRLLMETAVEAADKRVPVICSTGSNDTEYGRNTSIAAQRAGADGLLLVTPYYNKCTQDGIIKHYERILSGTDIPAIIYNVPSRTGFQISLESCLKLSKIDRIVGIKEASGNLQFAAALASQCGEDLPIYSGNDDIVLPIISIGGKGVISVISNILPGDMARLCRASLNGDYQLARELSNRLNTLSRLMFCEVNPIPIKAAMSELGLCEDWLRLPLTKISPENRVALKEALLEYGLM